jgi:hypothetical protein
MEDLIPQFITSLVCEILVVPEQRKKIPPLGMPMWEAKEIYKNKEKKKKEGKTKRKDAESHLGRVYKDAVVRQEVPNSEVRKNFF